MKEDSPEKISASLDDRLRRVDPQKTVRALVLLGPGTRAKTHFRNVSRVSRSQRSRTAEAIRADAAGALPEIDQILESHGGRRLADEVNALGAVPVESPAAGLRALAGSRHVKAILEDQPISLIRKK